MLVVSYFDRLISYFWFIDGLNLLINNRICIWFGMMINSWTSATDLCDSRFYRNFCSMFIDYWESFSHFQLYQNNAVCLRYKLWQNILIMRNNRNQIDEVIYVEVSYSLLKWYNYSWGIWFLFTSWDDLILL